MEQEEKEVESDNSEEHLDSFSLTCDPSRRSLVLVLDGSSRFWFGSGGTSCFWFRLWAGPLASQHVVGQVT